MPVAEVRERTTAQPDRVYLCPPDKYLNLRDGVLAPADPDERRAGLRIPIDTFFRSLARDRRERAIGVVLSGTGSEGALGLKEIHAAGGMTVVQTPETAGHPGMPRTAMATGVADHVLPVE